MIKMKLEKFLEHNWKRVLIVLVILVAWYLGNTIGLLHIPGVGFKSGGAIIGGYKACSCLGIPNNDIRIGGSRFYCIGVVYDCHCYLTTGFPGIGETQEVDCNCPEGKYIASWGTDYCNLFRSW